MPVQNDFIAAKNNVQLCIHAVVSCGQTKLGAVKFLIAEHSEVSKTRHFTVKFLSADFAAASKTAEKILAAF